MTPKHHNPLFHPKTLRNYFQSQSFPADLDTRRKQILPWIELLKSGKLGGEKEMSLHGQFLERVFGDILGYRGISQGGGQGCRIALQGLNQPLDSAARQIFSPIQQAWEDAHPTPGCRWILISNLREIRLYHIAYGPGNCEVFLVEELAQPEAFQRFYMLLAQDYILCAPSPVEDLLLRSAKQEAEITGQLYRDYTRLRVCVYERLCEGHSNLPKAELWTEAQRLLDRILLGAFAGERGLSAGTATDAPSTCANIDKTAILKVLSAYDFREEISVDVLGHIFEQSMADMPKRKAEGVFYTPSHITQFIVEETLGRLLDEIWQAIVSSYKPWEHLSEAWRDKAWSSAWEKYGEALSQVRVLDLSCGAGAFLTAAFDVLARAYDRVNAALLELNQGQAERLDVGQAVLNNNLFGLDLNGESVELTKASLWLKAARPGQTLGELNCNIAQANSIADNAGAIGARWSEGFHIVIGNPPYVRHERIGHYKEHLARDYRAYHGAADLYIYFIERGISLLKAGGRLGFIVPNKWMKAEYGVKLRSILAGETRVERMVDFGHAPIFPDADAFPCVMVLSKPNKPGGPVPGDHAVDVTQIPREALRAERVQSYVKSNSHRVPQSRLGAGPWSLEPPAVEALMERIRQKGKPLADYAKAKPCYGIKTGLNEAFLIGTAVRDQLVKADPRSAGVIKKYVRGQDIRRWSPAWNGEWMIALKTSRERPTPWASLKEPEAERCFESVYPALYARMKTYEEPLRKRSSRGQYWWELQSCPGDLSLEEPKMIWKDLSFHSEFCLDEGGYFANNLCYFLALKDNWLLAVLNSPLLWSYLWRHTLHGKDEVLRLRVDDMEKLPIAEPAPELREQAESIVPKMIGLSGQNRNPIHAEESRAAEERKRTLLALERRLAALVNSAYGLSPEDVKLLWATAPPRMPVGQ